MTEQCIIAASFHYFEPLSFGLFPSRPDQIKQTDGVERLSITLIGAKIKGLGEGMGDKDGKTRSRP